MRSHKLLFQAVKRHGSDEKMIRADSPLLDTARILFLLQCTARWPPASTTAWTPLSEHDKCAARSSRHRNSMPSDCTRSAEQRRASCSAVRPRQGHGCAVPRPRRRCVTSRGALHCSRLKAQDGCCWLGTFPGGRARFPTHVPCAPVAGSGRFCAPREVTRENEHSVTKQFIADLQQALVVRNEQRANLT